MVVEESQQGDFFRFASMLEGTTHQTDATALDQTVCLELGRDDIMALLERKPSAGIDMLALLERQFHASPQLVRLRASRNANDVIAGRMSFADQVADAVAHFGGSAWARNQR